LFDPVPKWLNDNQGVVSALIFVVTLFLGWISGIFASLRRKPNLRLALIPGPTLCTTFPTGEKQDNHDVHRTAISVYLQVANIGTAPTSIEDVLLGYHWHLRLTFTIESLSLWFRYRILWFWLLHPLVAMEDFHAKIGDSFKIYPSLLQATALLDKTTDTYLNVGQVVSGVVYFEQKDSWGACFPLKRSGKTRVKIAVKDAFGRKHTKSFWIPVVTLSEAKKYNPSFGETFPSLRKNASHTQTGVSTASEQSKT